MKKSKNQKSSDSTEATAEYKRPSPATAGARTSCLKILILLFSLCLVIALGIFVALNFQSISDMFSSLGYTPSESILEIRSSLDLINDGERIFNASRPVLNSAEDFNKSCDSHEENTSVLGCFVGHEIHIYNIDSSELPGIKESTAAHELLHAVWSRLDGSEKDRLTPYLEVVYEDKDYNKLLESDLKTYNDAERIDELHARIGTEIKTLPAELEEHYAKYFKDQDKIVDYYNSYIKPFNTLKDQISKLSSELTSLKEKIDAKTSEYEKRANELNSAISEFNGCANTLNCFLDRATFNNRRAELVAEQTAVNNLYTEVDNLIKDYNTKVNDYNTNVLKTKDLEDLINSNAKVNNL